ncbi:tetratricopeptide repeat protein [Collimonas sp. PA-H2]|uniref:tetratricopeptide repeat protein n=1 Tax=Collimonas sp. PA-H2 TaxID=1881062 RepID=UPI000BF43B6A|nr:tetratricopeptide repeat protein [Collimonas sp. PA-H2]PFH10291.1 tetratricopeptide repeat protein [Collimonas sp. PA-H2]
MRSYTASARSAFASICLTVLCAAPACADDMTAVDALFRGQRYAEALSGADNYLAQHPRAARMMFMKGLILAAQERTADAIAAFAEMTRDFPSLPEPYNNLAALYAGRGDYQDARDALENALRNNPAYEVAHENLGDVYLKLAGQAYDRALQLNAGSANARARTTMLHAAMTIQENHGVNLDKPPAAAIARSPQQAISAPLDSAARSEIVLRQQARLITATQ